MQFEVMLKNGETIYPIYDPEHKESVVAFYKARFEEGLIISWGIVS